MRAWPIILAIGLTALLTSCVFDRAGLWRPDGGADAGQEADAGPHPDGGCTDECVLGIEPRCSTDRLEVLTCAVASTGCAAWVGDSLCTTDDRCVDGTLDASAHCAPCATCAEGEATCVAGAPSLREACTTVGDCQMWEQRDCGYGALCQDPGAGAPAICESCVECTAIDPVCASSGLAVNRCALDPDTGCSAWETFDCPTDWSCTPGMLATACERDGTAGLNEAGDPGYPTSTFGNTASGTGPVLGSYLVADRYTTPVPLTAIQYRLYGTDGGNVRIALYDHDAANDLPGNRLLPEVTSALASNAWTTVALPSPTYLPAGTYWILFNASADDGVTYSTQTGGARVWKATAYSGALPASGGAGWTRSTSMDCTHLVAVAIRGYAKATRITVSEPSVDVNTLAFYAHGAGNARLAIYADSAGPGSRLWESVPTAAAAGGWTSVPVSAGTPGSLTLAAGTYWLAWQWDAPPPGLGYAAGAAGEGHFITLPWGTFPATWPGGTPSAETWSLNLTYTAQAPPIGW